METHKISGKSKQSHAAHTRRPTEQAAGQPIRPSFQDAVAGNLI